MQKVNIQLGEALAHPAALSLVNSVRTIFIEDGEKAEEWAKSEAEFLGIEFVKVLDVSYVKEYPY
jgi:hypothetical protein